MPKERVICCVHLGVPGLLEQQNKPGRVIAILKEALPYNAGDVSDGPRVDTAQPCVSFLEQRFLIRR